jgi:hypothetical protein
MQNRIPRFPQGFDDLPLRFSGFLDIPEQNCSPFPKSVLPWVLLEMDLPILT